jgi:hypothetical protein
MATHHMRVEGRIGQILRQPLRDLLKQSSVVDQRPSLFIQHVIGVERHVVVGGDDARVMDAQRLSCSMAAAVTANRSCLVAGVDEELGGLVELATRGLLDQHQWVDRRVAWSMARGCARPRRLALSRRK